MTECALPGDTSELIAIIALNSRKSNCGLIRGYRRKKNLASLELDLVPTSAFYLTNNNDTLFSEKIVAPPELAATYPTV